MLNDHYLKLPLKEDVVFPTPDCGAVYSVMPTDSIVSIETFSWMNIKLKGSLKTILAILCEIGAAKRISGMYLSRFCEKEK